MPLRVWRSLYKNSLLLNLIIFHHIVLEILLKIYLVLCQIWILCIILNLVIFSAKAMDL